MVVFGALLANIWWKISGLTFACFFRDFKRGL